MANFRVNCFKLTTESNNSKSNVYMKELHSYILDCEDYLSIKDVDWFQVILGLKQLDEEFENSILEEMRAKRVLIDTDKFYDGLLKLQKDYGALIIVKSCNIEYLKPAKLEDNLEITSRVKSLSKTSFVINQKIKKDNILISSANLHLVIVSKNGKPTASVP